MIELQIKSHSIYYLLYGTYNMVREIVLFHTFVGNGTEVHSNIISI